MSESIEESHFVYFMLPKIRKPDRMKVGITNNIQKRLREVSANSCHEMVCIWSIEFPRRDWALSIESNIHIALSEHRLKGEWFAFNPMTLGIIHYLDEQISGVDKNEVH